MGPERYIPLTAQRCYVCSSFPYTNRIKNTYGEMLQHVNGKTTLLTQGTPSQNAAAVLFADNIGSILGIRETTMDYSMFKCLIVNIIVGNFILLK